MSQQTDSTHAGETGPEEGTGYARFAAMIITSMVVMYGVMYLNTSQWAHVEFSETRVYMTFLMGASMTVVMMSYMWPMYRARRANVGVLLLAAVVFAGALWLVRSQATVDDRSYMRAMIPHHSIAVLTSTSADIDDVRVRALADRITATQCREIAEMQWLIEDIADHGEVHDPTEAERRAVPDFDDRC